MHLLFRNPIVLILLLGLTPAAAHAAENPPAGDRFKFTMDSHATIGDGANAIAIDAVTEIAYTWTQVDREKTLVLNWMRVKALFNGQLNMDVLQDRQQMVVTDAAGKKTVIKAENAPAEARALMDGVFGGPLCTITLDEQGMETKRLPTTRPAAKSVIDSGIVANCTVFHPATALAAKDEFTFEMEIGTGNGVVAGPVKYIKAAEAKPGQSRFTYSGTMQSKRIKMPDKPIVVENAKYVVSGEQIYDQARKQWSQGTQTVEISARMILGDDPPRDMKGRMKVKFELLP